MEGSERPQPFGSMASPFNADSAHSNSFANMNAGEMARVVRDAVVLVRDMDPCIIDWLRAVATNGNAPPPPVPAALGNVAGLVLPAASSPQRKKRNSRPCGTCSEDKIKCEKFPERADMCVRCHDKGLKKCPEHKPWKKKSRRLKNRTPSPPAPEHAESSSTTITS